MTHVAPKTNAAVTEAVSCHEWTHAALEQLASQYGSAFYVLYLERYRENWRRFSSALTSHYAGCQIAYSYKTNYCPSICRANDALGGLAEVVSGAEYAMARRLGVEPRHIVFNGPLKTGEELALALQAGAVVNVDNGEELQRILGLRRDSPLSQPFRVGLRCAFPVLGETRFGFDVETEEFDRACRILNDRSDIDFVGLHAHYCPPDRTAGFYGELTRRLCDLGKDVFGVQGPEMLNVGGGYFSSMPEELKGRWDYPIPSFADYGEAIGGEVAEAFDGPGPTLLVEPGMALVADVMEFVCQVDSVKTVSQRRVASLSGSVYNVKPTKNSADMPVRVFSGHAGGSESLTQLAGYTCMEDDIMHSGLTEAVSSGDFCVFSNVGAYSLVLKPPFIQPAPPILLYEPASERPVLESRPGTVDDLLGVFEL